MVWRGAHRDLRHDSTGGRVEHLHRRDAGCGDVHPRAVGAPVEGARGVVDRNGGDDLLTVQINGDQRGGALGLRAHPSDAAVRGDRGIVRLWHRDASDHAVGGGVDDQRLIRPEAGDVDLAAVRRHRKTVGGRPDVDASDHAVARRVDDADRRCAVARDVDLLAVRSDDEPVRAGRDRDRPDDAVAGRVDDGDNVVLEKPDIRLRRGGARDGRADEKREREEHSGEPSEHRVSPFRRAVAALNGDNAHGPRSFPRVSGPPARNERVAPAFTRERIVDRC
jgi:hypothetical protein